MVNLGKGGDGRGSRDGSDRRKGGNEQGNKDLNKEKEELRGRIRYYGLYRYFQLFT